MSGLNAALTGIDLAAALLVPWAVVRRLGDAPHPAWRDARGEWRRDCCGSCGPRRMMIREAGI